MAMTSGRSPLAILTRAACAAWLCGALFHLEGADASATSAPKVKRIPLVVGDMLFDVELALTPKARERGLMDRRELKPEEAMLFVFPDEKERRFWMKNTLIDLDILYLDSKGRVVSFASMTAEPRRGEHETEEQYEERLKLYPSKAPTRFAIEFRAGTLPLLHPEVGQTINLPTTWLLSQAR